MSGRAFAGLLATSIAWRAKRQKGGFRAYTQIARAMRGEGQPAFLHWLMLAGVAALGVRTTVLTRAPPQFAEVEVAAGAAPVSAPTPVSGLPLVQAPSCPGGRIEIVLPGEIIVRVDAQVDSVALRHVLDALMRR